MGIDIGTSNIKTSLFSYEGKEIVSVSKEHPLHSPRSGWVEQNPHHWWEGVRETVGIALSKKKITPTDIKAIGVSSQSWGVVPIDRQGQIIRPAILWMDRRSIEQSRKLEVHTRKEEWDVLVDSSYIVPKVLWIKEKEPENYTKTFKFLQVNSYINYRLCGETCMDISQEDPLQIFIRNQQSCSSISDFYESMGVSPDKMIDVRNSSEVIGTVTTAAAQETGLSAGTPVVAGAMDTSASALGMQIVNDNQTFHVAGQAGAIGVCLKKPLFDRRLCIHNHVIPDRWLVVGVMVATGASMRWIRDLFSDGEPIPDRQQLLNPFEMLSTEAGKSVPGANGVIFLPYLMGERTPIWDSNARGVFFGLSVKTRKKDLIRAVMEGCAFALRHNIEVMKSAGIEIDEIMCAGGAINSELWNQIKSNVTKKSLLCISALPTTTLGNAILAGLGIGVYKELFQFDTTYQEKKVFHPSAGTFARYDRIYELYKKLYKNLKNEFNELALVNSSDRDLRPHDL
jgi:xylulokinase